MSKKFIPNGDLDFVTMAERFAGTVVKDPARYAASREDAEALGAAVAKFRAALQSARGGARSVVKTREKDLARGEAEAIIRRLANVARATKTLDPVAKLELGLRERGAGGRPRQLACPQEPPRLRFVRAVHEEFIRSFSAIPLSFRAQAIEAECVGVWYSGSTRRGAHERAKATSLRSPLPSGAIHQREGTRVDLR